MSTTKTRDFADALITHTDISLSWADRIRALVHGKVYVRVESRTENEVGYAESESFASVPHIWQRRERLGAHATARSEDTAP